MGKFGLAPWTIIFSISFSFSFAAAEMQAEHQPQMQGCTIEAAGSDQVQGNEFCSIGCQIVKG